MKHAVIAIVGEPNAGKSTLMNAMIGQKLSIVTHKAQTTRNVISGIITLDNTQLVFLDTPGIFDAKRAVDKFIVKQAWATLKSSDLVLVLIDTTKPISEAMRKVLSYLKDLGREYIVGLNKIDRLKRITEARSRDAAQIERNNLEDAKLHDHSTEDIDNNMHIAPQATDLEFPDAIKVFQISALYHKLDGMLDYLCSFAYNPGHLHDADELTTLPFKFLAQEVTREKAMLLLHDEIPYNLIVETENFEQKDNQIKIWQVIKVTTNSHKKIVLGRGGEKIKSIGVSARQELEKVYGYKTHLFLHVQVRSNMMDKDDIFDIR